MTRLPHLSPEEAEIEARARETVAEPAIFFDGPCADCDTGRHEADRAAAIQALGLLSTISELRAERDEMHRRMTGLGYGEKGISGAEFLAAIEGEIDAEAFLADREDAADVDPWRERALKAEAVVEALRSAADRAPRCVAFDSIDGPTCGGRCAICRGRAALAAYDGRG